MNLPRFIFRTATLSRMLETCDFIMVMADKMPRSPIRCLPNKTEDFSTYILTTSRLPSHDALVGRQDGNPHTTQYPRDIFGTDINTATGAAHTF
jgi:hypothetical protein